MNQRPYNGPQIALPFSIRASEPRWSGFCPPMLPGLLAWFDSSQLGLADGAAIATFTDFSGKGRSATQAGAKRFTYKRPPVGLPYAVCSAANNTSMWSPAFTAVAQPITVYTVVRSTINSSARQLCDGGDNTHRIGQVISNLGGASYVWQIASGSQVRGNVAATDQWIVVATVHNGANSYMYTNGAKDIGPVDSGAHSLTRIVLGNNYAETAAFDGHFAESCWFAGAHDAATVAFMSDYFLQKWNVYFRYPFTLPGLYAWWSPENVTGTDGAAIGATYKDFSGFGNDATQADPAKQFVFRANALGGRPMMELDGARVMSTAAFAATITQPYTILVHAKRNATGANLFFVDGIVSGRAAVYGDASDKLSIYAGAALQGAAGTVDTNYNRIVGYFNGASSTIHKNGALVAGPGSPGTQVPTGIVLGAAVNLSSNLVGKLGDVVFCRADVGAAGRAIFEAAMTQRYGA